MHSNDPGSPATPLPLLTKPPADLAGWVRRFETIDLPVLATTADQVAFWSENEDDVDAHALSDLITKDPLMTLRVLRHGAQLRSHRLLADVETVTGALVLIGITPFFQHFKDLPRLHDRLDPQPEVRQGFARVLRRAERAARFALGFAVHRTDPDAAIIHSAALLHDFAELLLWIEAPQLALQMRQRQLAEPTLRSHVVQRELLNITLAQLEQGLMKAWDLPLLLTHITDDQRANDPQVQCVMLAVRLARHTADDWNNPAVPDDVRDISELLKLRPEHTEILLHDLDQDDLGA
ncbi:HDOD domain-containing protein [Roseateles sp. BYS180W]|uniref:HDOD domain-containing protein n=1 Tax=Roseateles rivi TaxID=3299028 RepID=A0ABW7FWP8_9BURK